MPIRLFRLQGTFQIQNKLQSNKVKIIFILLVNNKLLLKLSFKANSLSADYIVTNKKMSSSHKKSRRSQSISSSSKKNKISTSQSSLTKNKLIDFLLKTAEVERKLQIIKQMLCQQQQFTPASLFHRLDAARKGFIVEKDIQEFLIDNKISFKGSQLKLLYGKLNANKSEAGVNLREFQNVILPNQNARLRYFTMRRPIFIPLQHQKLTDKIEWIVSKLFTQIMSQKIKLISFDFNANQIFKNLANAEGFITGQSINRFMNENHIQISVEEIGCLIKIMDKKGQGRVHKSDFKYYLATLGLKKQHDIFDQLSPIPALKNFQNSELATLKDRDSTLYQRYIDNKMYAKQFQQAQLARSRKSSALSRSRKNY